MTQNNPLELIEKLETGIPGFDFLSEGGLPKGRATLIAGTAGSAKTVFACQFLAEGIKNGENGVFVTFEEPPQALMGLRHFRAAKKAQTITGQRVNLDL
jgi:circadian clock protein KaiC